MGALVIPFPSSRSVALFCDACGEDVPAGEELFCPCGLGLCEACLVLGEDIDTCAGCADRAAYEAAVLRGDLSGES